MPKSGNGSFAVAAAALIVAGCSQAEDPGAPQAPSANEEQALDRAQEMIDSRPDKVVEEDGERAPQGEILPVESTAPIIADTPDD